MADSNHPTQKLRKTFLKKVDELEKLAQPAGIIERFFGSKKKKNGKKNGKKKVAKSEMEDAIKKLVGISRCALQELDDMLENNSIDGFVYYTELLKYEREVVQFLDYASVELETANKVTVELVTS